MIDLSTRYLGLPLGSPLVASASPLCESVDNIRAMEDAGADAVVLHSLFEEQLDVESTHLDRYLTHGAESYAEALDYFPDLTRYNLGPDAYLEHVRRAKEAVGIPIIGSLNGVSTGGWIEFAKKIEQAGADALELNVYYVPTDPALTSAEVERMYIDLVRDVKASVSIPVAVKLGHAFTAFANVARHLDDVGRGWTGPLQPLLPAGLRPRPTRGDATTDPVEPARVARASSLGGNPPRSRSGRPGGDGRRPHRAGCAEGDDGGRQGRHDDFRAPQARHRRPAGGAESTWWRGWRRTSTHRSAQMQGSMSYRSVAEPAAFERANYMKVLSSYALRTAVPPRRTSWPRVNHGTR